MSVFLAIILFISFTIGLNLGLHGVIVLNNRQNVIDSHPATVLEPQSWQQSHISHQPHEKPQTNPLDRELSGGRDSSSNIHSKADPSSKNPTLFQGQNTVSEKNLPSSSSQSTLDTAVTKDTVEEIKVWDKTKVLDEAIQQLAKERVGAGQSLATKYANSPLVLLTCNRPQLLDETLRSALKVGGVSKDKILIVQDGNMQQIQDVAKRYSINIIQNQQGIRLRGGAADDGASRIAQHYKFALSSAFDHFRDAQAIVIIEDDLLFAPDFYEYLTTTAQVLDADPTTFVVSSWSDNGFKGKVHDPYAIRRTDFFPGLGWILTRNLYKNELEEAWPREHWDHWLRSDAVHKHRETVYPQVPRTFHNGVKGTFMNVETHNRYFKDIAINEDSSVTWENSIQHLTVTEDIYERRVEKLINMCKHLTDVQELASFNSKLLAVHMDVDFKSFFLYLR